MYFLRGKVEGIYMHKVETLHCQNCGSQIAVTDKRCEYCGSIVTITSTMDFAHVDKFEAGKYLSLVNNDSKTLGFCYLKLGQYQKAKDCLLIALDSNVNDSLVFFAIAIATLGNKKPFLHARESIEEIERYLQSAITLESLGIYYFFFSYLRFDYHKRKFFDIAPNCNDLLIEAQTLGFSKDEVEAIFECLELDLPSYYK